MGVLTRAEVLHVEVLGGGGFCSLLHQQLVHGADGRGHVVRSQVERSGLFTSLLLQTTETSEVNFIGSLMKQEVVLK